MGWASGAPPNSETRVAGCRGAPWARARRGPSSAGARGGEAGGRGGAAPPSRGPPSTPPGPLPGAESLPSPDPRRLFPRPARGPADGPRCLRAEQPSLPPPARPPLACPGARPAVRASVCPRVRLSQRAQIVAQSAPGRKPGGRGVAKGSGPGDRRTGPGPRRSGVGAASAAAPPDL